MAIHIAIFKEYEDTEIAIYRFSPDKQSYGRLQINKHTGDLSQLTALSIPNAPIYMHRAMSKILKHHNKGEYPDITNWAS